ncbi:MAG: hypothetical protein ABI231_07215 [Candidatus Tumulicola sp.]
MPPITRRELVQTGAAGVALLALANCARSTTPARPPFDDPRYAYRALAGGDRELLAAVASALLAGSLPADPAAYAAALVRTVRGVDVAVSGLPPAVRAEVHQLFGLLEFAPTRGFAAGIWSSWGDASPRDVADFLTHWRFSGVALFRSGYQALHQLVMAAWYGNPSSWARIGYPGPPAVSE